MTEKNFYVKSHGLGNEYIVLAIENIDFELTTNAVKHICDVHYGIGSDGILLRIASTKADFGLRIFNPDGSEAEKSGNGLRIFSKYLYDYGHTTNRTFTIETMGGIVTASIEETENGKARMITVEMGQAIFKPSQIPVNIAKETCIDESFTIEGREFLISCLSVGNPHAVILVDEQLTIEEVKKYGPLIEHHPKFPNRINVQFVKVINKNEIEILIWERGAGYTLASGSSSCAAATMMHKKNLVDSQVTVNMPGGKLKISIDKDYYITMTGPVRQIADGHLSKELVEDFKRI